MDLSMNFTEQLNLPFSPIQNLDDALFESNKLKIFIKRDDLIHPQIHGNKWRKLKHNLTAFQVSGKKQILTFGGAFSNHIHATAAAGQLFNLKTIGVIRGERASPLSPTLIFAEKCGMKLHFVSRETYRHKDILLKELHDLYGDFYHLPEGGTNNEAVLGCIEIIDEVHTQLGFKPDYFCVACGTGGTLSGLILACEPHQNIVGMCVLKNDNMFGEVTNILHTFTISDIELTKVPFNLIKKNKTPTNWNLKTEYHFEGYAKWSSNLIKFINEFKIKYGIALDPVYNGKMFYGVFDLVRQGYFKENSTIVLIHTGGLQGVKGFNDFVLNKHNLSIE
jgi:1-aminocyclopropane-1-carboxylate deaminase